MNEMPTTGSIDADIEQYDNAINAYQVEIDAKREELKRFVREREVLTARRDAEKKFAAMSPAEREAWKAVAGKSE